MASGSFYKNFTSYNYQVIVEWSSTATTSTNSSVITANVYLNVIYSLYTSAHSGSTLYINGVAYDFESPNISVSNGSKVLLATITSDAIAHNSDGSKSITITCDYAVNATISGTYYGTITASDTITLDTIPRKATLSSAENFNDEANPTITYSNPAGSAVVLYAGIYDSTGSTAYAAYRKITATSTSYTFSLTDAERNAMRNAIPSAKSMTVRFYLKTVISGTNYYSYISKTFSITNGNPTISPTIKDTNSTTLALTGSADTIVKYFSNAAITVGASAIKGATLSSQKAICGGKSFTTASGTLEAVESGTFSFTATDSRGNTTTKSVSKTFIEYIKLTCSFKPTITVDGVATLSVSGNYFSGSFGSVSNSLTVSYRYKAAGGDYGDWATISTSGSNGSYSGSASITIADFDYKATYTFQVKASDALTSVAEKTYSISAKPVFDWSGEDFNFNVPITCDTINGYNITGAMKAMTTVYNHTSPSITLGDNYTAASGSAALVGNTMRVYFTSTRSSAASAGNITDEVIATFTYDVGGKVKNIYTVYGISPNNNSSYYISGATVNSDGTITFSIKLSGVGVSGSTFAGYLAVPIAINLDKY